jgi:hypothetical protein
MFIGEGTISTVLFDPIDHKLITVPDLWNTSYPELAEGLAR